LFRVREARRIQFNLMVFQGRHGVGARRKGLARG
jgi:hypothetical protein